MPDIGLLQGALPRRIVPPPPLPPETTDLDVSAKPAEPALALASKYEAPAVKSISVQVVSEPVELVEPAVPVASAASAAAPPEPVSSNVAPASGTSGSRRMLSGYPPPP